MKFKCKFLAFCLILAVIFCGCSADPHAGQRSIELYYTNPSHDRLIPQVGYIREEAFANSETLVKAVLEQLFDNPTDEQCVRVIPEGLFLRGVSVSSSEEGMVNIDLGGDYYGILSRSDYASDELLARYSIVCTLCQFEEIKKVKIFINREDLKNKFGEGDIVPPMGRESVLMNSPSSVETQTERFVTLYFTDKSGKKLYPETRKATMTDNSMEKTIVNEIIRGPVSDDLERTVSPDAELISVETAEKICFVNFASGFMSDVERGSDAEKITLYSIVNSLTRLKGIEKVQILIDGKKPENDTHQLFSNPIERNIYIIEELAK